MPQRLSLLKNVNRVFSSRGLSSAAMYRLTFGCPVPSSQFPGDGEEASGLAHSGKTVHEKKSIHR
jgi:hypothetical protein